MAANYSNKIFGFLLGLIAIALVVVILVPIPREIQHTSHSYQPDLVNSDNPILVSFIGDSTCVGAGDNLTVYKRWPNLVSKKLNWFSINACVGGTGYLSSGFDGKSNYVQVFERLSLKLKTPNIIIIEGGQNDFAENTGVEISTAACDLYAKIRKNFPKVDLIVMTPFYGLTEAPPFVSEAENAINKCTTKYKARVISGVRKWLQDHPELLIADKTHPNGKGHALIAKNFVAWFKANPSK